MAEQYGGTQSAQHLSPGEGKALWFFTDLYIAKRLSEDTGGAHTLFEVTSPPHSHLIPGDVPANALVLYTPAGVEGWIEEGGKPGPDPPAPPPPSEVPEQI